MSPRLAILTVLFAAGVAQPMAAPVAPDAPVEQFNPCNPKIEKCK